MEGFHNIDISPLALADEFYDITKGLRDFDNTVDEVHAGCVLEQIESNRDFIFVMNEIHRVLKPGGKLYGYVPSTHPDVMFLDFMDRRFFHLNSFDYFDTSKNAWNQFGKDYGIHGFSSSSAYDTDNHIIHFELTK
jgi:SAM-dependent methyltransferase